MLKKILFLAIFIFLLTTYSLLLTTHVRADELSEIEKKLTDLKRALELSVAATTPLEKNLDKIRENLENIKSRILLVEKEVKNKEQQVVEGEKLLGLAEELLSQKVKRLYKYSSRGGKTLFLLLNSNLPLFIREFGYQKRMVENDKETIVKVVLYIKDLEEKKKSLENEKIRLFKIKEETDTQASFLAKEIAGAKKYQEALSSQIAQLSQRQRDLITQKLAGLNLPTSLGAGLLYCIDDRKIDPGFRPAFAFFTFGIPHRVGMNQYGAYGRARASLNYQEILRAYYEGISFEKRDPNLKIKIQGHGEKTLEEYLLGIYEMPNDWPLEALKAQAVAARSYALAYTNNGQNEICTSQLCQVWKSEKKGGNWEQAVKATEGEVMVNGGQVIKAWYASTFGGFSFTSGDVWGSNRPWTKRMRDTKGEINSFSDLLDKSYDRDSPCFYAAQGWRAEFGKSAWIKEEELADIINVILLVRKDEGVREHLYQLDKPNPEGKENWDRERVKQELKNRGVIPFNRISDVSIDWDKGVGQTTNIKISGDSGSVSFEGGEFKNFFNLRAPSNIQIVGPLYNVERK